jgi:hypothetical protein
MLHRARFAFTFAVLLGVVGPLLGHAAEVRAGTVIGRVDLPPPPARPEVAVKGFVDRVENPRKPIQPVNVTPQLLVVLEGEAPLESSSRQVVWELVGESFARPVIGVPVGGELVIKNKSKTARALAAAEDPKLLQPGPINPTGPKSFRATAPAIYTIGDADSPHLTGTVVVVGTPYIATVDPAGKFEIPDVAEGTYKIRVFYQSGWIDRPDDTVTVGPKKTDVTVKIPAGYPLKK